LDHKSFIATKKEYFFLFIQHSTKMGKRKRKRSSSRKNQKRKHSISRDAAVVPANNNIIALPQKENVLVFGIFFTFATCLALEAYLSGKKKKRTCTHLFCKKDANFGPPDKKGSRYATHCAEHKPDAYVDIVSKRCQYTNCSVTNPLFGPSDKEGSQYATHCAEHKPEGYVDIVSKRCEHEGCLIRNPSFGPPDKLGFRYATHCSEHKPANYINIVSKHCQQKDCSVTPSFGLPNKRGRQHATHCAEHKPEGYVDIVSKRCQHEGCLVTNPKFGPPNKRGFRYATHCSLHKPRNYIDIVCKGCQYKNCSVTHPLFGPSDKQGSQHATHCAEHKPEGYVDIVSKRCQHEGCLIRNPVFGPPDKSGFRYATHCLEHKPINYINIVSKHCQQKGCTVINPLFGPPNKRGRRHATHCSAHKLDGYVDIVSKRCQQKDCPVTNPVFGPPDKWGSRYATHCASHKPDGYIDITHKKCCFTDKHGTKCETRATYGQLFQEKQHCAKHKQKNEYVKNKPKCTGDKKCKQQPCYTDKPDNFPLRCEQHKLCTDEEKNVVETECSSCHLKWFIKEGNVCNDCHAFQTKSPAKRREDEIQNLLKTSNIRYNTHDKKILHGCSLFRPDFVIDCGTHIIIIEVDEDQHRSYNCQCEQSRMIQIFQDFGGLPVCFIRYNPDSYTDANGIKHRANSKQASRHARLLSVIRAVQLHPPHMPDNILHVIYLYYDGDKETQNEILAIRYESAIKE
jgi:hypothetical protein